MNIAHTLSRVSLFDILRSTDIEVPLRSEGRTTGHVERWSICRLLATLADTSEIDYPVALIKRERPDFLLTVGSGRRGIEIIEAVSPQYAEYSALAEREYPDSLLEPSHFRWGEPKKTIKEMRAFLEHSQLSGPPWVGDSAEREWALFIASVVAAKTKKLNSDGFEIYERNWLLIYDNLPTPHINLSKALAALIPQLPRECAPQPIFDTIYIEHGSSMIRIRDGCGVIMTLVNLW